jgi:hypothetical protein
MYKNEISNIYSIINNPPTSFRKIQNSVFEESQNAILAAQEFETKINELWLNMTIFEKLITPEKSVFPWSLKPMYCHADFTSQKHMPQLRLCIEPYTKIKPF